MKRIITSLYRRYRNLLLYGIIGACSAGLDFLVFTLLVNYAGLHYIVANCISIFTGISTSFVLNRNYNFKVKDDTHRRFSLFLAIGLGGLLLSNLILYLCVEQGGLGSLPSKLLAIVVVSLLQFLANKYITFKPNRS